MTASSNHKPHFTVGVTCVGGTFIADVLNALRAAPDFTVTIIGVDANAAARGRVLCDHFAVLPMAFKNGAVLLGVCALTVSSAVLEVAFMNAEGCDCPR